MLLWLLLVCCCWCSRRSMLLLLILLLLLLVSSFDAPLDVASASASRHLMFIRVRVSAFDATLLYDIYAYTRVCVPCGV